MASRIRPSPASCSCTGKGRHRRRRRCGSDAAVTRPRHARQGTARLARAAATSPMCGCHVIEVWLPAAEVYPHVSEAPVPPGHGDHSSVAVCAIWSDNSGTEPAADQAGSCRARPSRSRDGDVRAAGMDHARLTDGMGRRAWLPCGGGVGGRGNGVATPWPWCGRRSPGRCRSGPPRTCPCPCRPPSPLAARPDQEAAVGLPTSAVSRDCKRRPPIHEVIARAR